MGPTTIRVKTLLDAGMHPRAVASGLGISPQRVYRIARRHRLPTNRIPSSREAVSISQAVTLYGFERTCQIYRFSPPHLQRVLRTLPHEIRVRHSSGHPGATPPPDAREPGSARSPVPSLQETPPDRPPPRRAA